MGTQEKTRQLCATEQATTSPNPAMEYVPATDIPTPTASPRATPFAPTPRPFSAFSEYMAGEGFTTVTLTIYYLSVGTASYSEVSETALINGYHDFKMTVSWRRLMRYYRRIMEISKITLQEATEIGEVDARICLIYTADDGTEVLRITFWDTKHNMIVNGVPVQEDPAFYDLFLPFLPASDAAKFEEWRPWGKIEVTDPQE